MATPQQQQRQEKEPDGGFTFEEFAGVNTATVRAGVPDEQAYWLDGAMPLARRQLRLLWGVGPAVYTPGGGLTILFYGFYNIGATPYAVIFLSDGSVVQLNTTTNAVTTILPASSIVNPSITSVGISQYGQQYLLIVSTQTNGYWIWDGSVIYSAGSLAPQITLTNVGSAYQTAPAVIFTGGHGGGATAVAAVNNGVVTGISITNAGTGWQAGDSVSVVLTGGTQAGSGANLAAIMGHSAGGSGASITSGGWTQTIFVNGKPGYVPTTTSVVAAGSGYSPFVTGAWTYVGANGFWYNGPPGIGVQGNGGSITHVNYVGTGTWVVNSGAFPGIGLSDPGNFFVSSVSVVAGGTNYSPNTSIVASGGASPVGQATLFPFITSGSISSVGVVFGGYYGNSSPAATISAVDTAVTATAVANLMPIGISGNAVQTYQGHVWVFNGPNFNFTAPGSVWNFATSAGGGSDQNSDNFLKVSYTAAINTNGFLFAIGDSSLNYFSGVQTSGNPPTTVFTNQNSDPEIGTPYPATATTLGQEILIANSTGIFVSSGGNFIKRSEMLDGVFNTVPNFGGLQLSAAKATIFGKRVWMVLTPIIDPVSGVAPIATSGSTAPGSAVINLPSTAGITAGMLAYDGTNPTAIPAGTTVLSVASNSVTLSANVVSPGVSQSDTIYFFVQKLFMFNGRQWWASMQDVPLTFIAAQEINSTFTAWGTNGTSLYRLFQRPSVGFTKTIQTKLWDNPGYEATKAVDRFWSLWQVYGSSPINFTLDIDAIGLDFNNQQFDNSQSYSMTAQGAINTGTATVAQAIGQQGILLGMTIITSAADGALISAKMHSDVYQSRS